MRRYCYRNPEGREIIFGGQFEFEVRGEYALVLLADHLVPLADNEIPTRIFRQFLTALDPADLTFVELDIAAGKYNLLDCRWTETAGAYRYLGAERLSEYGARAVGLMSPWWTRAVESLLAAPRPAALGSHTRA